MPKARVLVSQIAWNDDDGHHVALEGDVVELPKAEIDRFVFGEIEPVASSGKKKAAAEPEPEATAEAKDAESVIAANAEPKAQRTSRR